MAYEISLRGAQHGAVQAEAGETLLHVLQRAGCAPEAPCGGNGTCGKCRVLITDGEGTREVRACQTIVSENLTVTLPEKTAGERILTEGAPAVADYKRFLSGGSSTDPISLLKIAGVDMSHPESIDSALALFGELIDELDKLI